MIGTFSMDDCQYGYKKFLEKKYLIGLKVVAS
jgi:hypothetical protein